MKFLKDNWLIIAVVILFGGNLLQYINPVVKIKEVVTRDTTVVVDSVSLTRAKSELNYLRERLKTAQGKIVYVQKTDTIRIVEQNGSETNYIVPNFIASLDTTINQSRLFLSYHYPQNYFSDIRFTYPKVYEKTTTTIVEKPLFDFSHGIILGVGLGVIAKQPDIFIGYGFKLGLNF